MITYPPRGLVANLVTPLDGQGLPDGPVFRRLMKRLGKEVAGYLVGSLEVGEAWWLEPQSRLALLAATVEAGLPLPLMFEVTGKTPRETTDLLVHSEEVLKRLSPRATVYYYLTPLVYHGNRGLPGHVLELTRLTGRSWVLANDPALVTKARPGPHHKNIRTSVLKKLLTNEQVAAMAFDVDLTRAMNYQRAVKHRPGFRFYDLNESGFLERPSSSGLISPGANLLPQAWSDLVASSLNIFDSQRPFPDHLSQIWHSGHQARELLAHYQTNPAAVIKSMLFFAGLTPGYRTAPGGIALTQAEMEAIKEVIKGAGIH